MTFPASEHRRADWSPYARGAIDQSIPARFAQQCQRVPDRHAICTSEGPLTYAELDAWSNSIGARVLEHLDWGSEPVPFLLAQGPLAVATTIGILKTGKFFVPLDPSWGPARLAELIAELRACLVVSSREFAPMLSELASGATVLALPAERPCTGAAEAIDPEIAPDCPAYVYFTSGSTGRPKGVIDCHRNVLHNVMRYTNALFIDEVDRLSLLQSCGFSGAASSMFAALSNGAACCPIDMRTETPANLADWIERLQVTIYHSVPSIFRSLMSPGRVFRSVRAVRLEGDRATRLDLELFRTHFAPPSILAVGLGATETGLVSQYFYDHAKQIPAGVVPIGYPVTDVSVEIEADGALPAPEGTVGEIVVHSRYLALGYWNDPALTTRAFKERFTASGERTYRTGDLGRIADDGCVEYLGRLDGRVRIRGQWVELADVDAALTSLPGVREAVTGAIEDMRGEVRLVAWYVAAAVPGPSVSALRRKLTERMPPHLVPSRFVELDALPHNANGKVDRRGLPHPEPVRPRLDSALAVPRNLVQLRLQELWEDLLGIRPVGTHDSFFELGGDSLLAVSMMDRVEQVFGRRVPLSVLLHDATIEGIAAAVLELAPEMEAPIVPVRPSGSRRPCFFLHGDYHSGGFYCLELARHLDDAQPFYALPPCGYDGDPIPSSYQAMARRHLDAIRSVQPHGPYRLGGQCNGGLIALEIARLLEADGEQVEALALLWPSAENVRFRSFESMIKATGTLMGVSAAGQQYAFRRLRDFVTHMRGMSMGRRLVHCLGKLARLHAEIGMVARADQRPRATAADPDTFLPEVFRARIWESYQQVDRAYVPRRYRGRASLIWPDDDPTPVAVEAARWHQVVADLEILTVPGDQKSSLTHHVDKLASALQDVLDRCGSVAHG